MSHTIHKQGNEGWTVNKKRRRGEEEDGEHTETEGTLQKFGKKSRKLPHEGGDIGRTPPKISLAESSKKNNTDRERLARPQGRLIKEAFDRSEGPQRERVLLPTLGHYVQEDLHLDGSPNLHNGRLQDDMVLEATRMRKWNNNTKLANHTDIVKIV